MRAMVRVWATRDGVKDVVVDELNRRTSRSPASIDDAGTTIRSEFTFSVSQSPVT